MWRDVVDAVVIRSGSFTSASSRQVTPSGRPGRECACARQAVVDVDQPGIRRDLMRIRFGRGAGAGVDVPPHTEIGTAMTDRARQERANPARDPAPTERPARSTCA